MADLKKLKYLQLVSKVTAELENNLGIADKTLAEFVIDVAVPCENFKIFDQKLRENGADFPIDFVDKLLRLVKHLHPKFSEGSQGGAGAKSGACTAGVPQFGQKLALRIVSQQMRVASRPSESLAGGAVSGGPVRGAAPRATSSAEQSRCTESSRRQALFSTATRAIAGQNSETQSATCCPY